MARQLICDICDLTYTEQRQNQKHQKIEFNGKSYTVYIDITSEEAAEYSHLDVCPNCKKQALSQLLDHYVV